MGVRPSQWRGETQRARGHHDVQPVLRVPHPGKLGFAGSQPGILGFHSPESDRSLMQLVGQPALPGLELFQTAALSVQFVLEPG